MQAGSPPLSPASPSSSGRPRLILVAVGMDPRYGSEPGKAWHWACALARHYELHVVTPAEAADRCRHDARAAGWHWHFPAASEPKGTGLAYYAGYWQWCAAVPAVLRQLRRTIDPVGIHHIALGSFRVLPRYDRTGLPWTLGPLGGGETIPDSYRRTALLPPGPKAVEMMRPWLNRAFTLLPWLRPVMQGARLVLATTVETEAVLRQFGAARTAVTFPDAAQGGPPPAEVRVRRSAQAAEIGRELRLVWSARALWWKGGQLAIELTRRLVEQGVAVRLEIISQGPALPALRRRVRQAGLETCCQVRNFVPRAELLELLLRAHGFVYPTLHDSSSSALLDAYLAGLPSLTVGVGGPCLVVAPAAGYNTAAPDLNVWLDGAAAAVRTWMRNPSLWLAASEAALARSAEFSPAHLDRTIDRWLAPATQIYGRRA